MFTPRIFPEGQRDENIFYESVASYNFVGFSNHFITTNLSEYPLFFYCISLVLVLSEPIVLLVHSDTNPTPFMAYWNQTLKINVIS